MGRGKDVTKVYDAKKYRTTTPSGEGIDVAYRLMAPEHVEPGKRYPLVLFLHGAGERGSDNELQLKYLPTWLATSENRQKYPSFVLAPQCPEGMKWSDVDWGSKASTPQPELSGPMRAVIGMLQDTLAQNAVDRNRVYLTGLSMGGYGSWDLAERMPQQFAALAPICGGGDETKADRLVNLPIWAWHGEADTAVPVERSRRMIAAIEKAGGKPKYTELTGVGHDSWTPAYTGPDNLLAWMFAQAKRSAVDK